MYQTALMASVVAVQTGADEERCGTFATPSEYGCILSVDSPTPYRDLRADSTAYGNMYNAYSHIML